MGYLIRRTRGYVLVVDLSGTAPESRSASALQMYACVVYIRDSVLGVNPADAFEVGSLMPD